MGGACHDACVPTLVGEVRDTLYPYVRVGLKSTDVRGTTLESEPTPTRAMQIGEVAQRTDLSLRTLRHYDEVGLLRPSGRSDGGFRLYTEEDLERLLVIRRMKPLGFTLEEMVQVMRHIETLHGATALRVGSGPPRDERADEARTQLAGTLDEAYARRDRLRQQLGMADEFIGLLSSRLGRQMPDPGSR